MYDKDPHQNIRGPGYGQAIRSADLRKIVALVLQNLRGGDGILVERHGQNVIVKLAAGARGAGGGGGWNNFYDATTKAGLIGATNVPEKSFARVTAGAQKGMVAVPNPDRDGWDALNFFE